MIKYKFYLINDPSKEAIGYIHAENYDEAYYIASKIKKLELQTFKKLFDIESV